MIASATTPHPLLRSRSRSRSHVHLRHQNPSFCFPSAPSATRNNPIPPSRSPLSPLPALPSDVSSSEAAHVPPPADGFDSDSDTGPDATEAGDGVEVEVVKVGRNRRRIRARVVVDACMEALWAVLTDYEGLAEFIPSLAVSRLVEKGEGFDRLYQVGLQDLALGLKFQAKGTLDCFEKDLEFLPSGRKRDIEFRMVEGDFQTFEGAWSILQSLRNPRGGGNYSIYPPATFEETFEETINDGIRTSQISARRKMNHENREDDGFFQGQDFQTALSYVVELEPKLWLPVRLLEGRLCREVKTNLLCVRDEAQRVQKLGHDALPTW